MGFLNDALNTFYLRLYVRICYIFGDKKILSCLYLKLKTRVQEVLKLHLPEKWHIFGGCILG